MNPSKSRGGSPLNFIEHGRLRGGSIQGTEGANLSFNILRPRLRRYDDGQDRQKYKSHEFISRARQFVQPGGRVRGKSGKRGWCERRAPGSPSTAWHAAHTACSEVR